MAKLTRDSTAVTIGLISDTHGLLRPEAVAALQDAEMIIHAGDIGDESILKQLELIAPVRAVRGNMDHGNWAHDLRMGEVIELKGVTIYVLHDISRLDVDPEVAGVRVIVFGHSHRPSIREHKGTLYVNPGSAGPRRFRLPVSVALLHVSKNQVKAEIITLKV